MAKLTYVFKATGLSDFPVEFKLEGINDDIAVEIEITDAIWTVASMTGDIKTAFSVSMAADIAACDTILKIGANLSKVQRAYGAKSTWALNGLFKDAVQRAMDTYIQACSDLADKLMEEELK